MSRGSLLIIGGAEDKDGDCIILKKFLELAGGADAHILILGTATTLPEEVGATYLDAFQRIGARKVSFLALDNREAANDQATLELLESCSGVFFTGGDQMRITDFVGGSKVDVWLHQAFEQRGLVLAGTSAGAAMMSAIMVLGGHDTIAATSAVRLGPGLEFLPGVVIDMHFAQRGRVSRLLSAVAQFPHEIGIGIDEDTALVVHGEQFEVIGSGAVTILDAGQAAAVVIPKREGAIAMTNAKIHVLPHGYTFNLRTRLPVVIQTPEDAEEIGA